MSEKYTENEVMARMSQLMVSSGEIVEAYRDLMISRLMGALEVSNEFKDIRFIQGQIAGIRDFCSFVQE